MTAVATQPQGNPVAHLKAGLEQMRPQLAVALPQHIPVERFERIVLTAVNVNPDLMQADRRSLFNACQRAAQDGLLPDGREAALVIFNTKIKRDGKDEWVKAVQYMPMVFGIIKKVRQSGEVVEFRSRVVYEKDTFRYTLGDEETIEHVPFLGDAGKPVAVYAIARGKDDWVEREVMTYAEVECVRAVSKSKDNGPWVAWWTEMARKTVMRRLSKRLPISAEIMQTFEADDDLRASDPPPQRPTRAEIAHVATPETETPTDEADAANRALDREAGAIINGTVETDETEHVDAETGEVTEALALPVLPPEDGDRNGWLRFAKVLIAVATAEQLSTLALPDDLPDVLRTEINKALKKRSGELSQAKAT